MLESLIALLLAVAPNIGKVVHSQGGANHNGLVARIGTVVKAGDRILTGPASLVVIALAGGGAVRIYPQSSVILHQAGSVDLIRGRLLNAFRGQGRYGAKTPRLTAAVTGTSFYLEETPRLGGYVCTCTGSVAVESATHPGHGLALAAPASGRHRAISVMGTRQVASPMLGHSDPEVDDLLAIAGQTLEP